MCDRLICSSQLMRYLFLFTCELWNGPQIIKKQTESILPSISLAASLLCVRVYPTQTSLTCAFQTHLSNPKGQCISNKIKPKATRP